MTFHKGAVRLAGLYLAVMMAISLLFSINIYHLSIREFDRGLRSPGTRAAIRQLNEVSNTGSNGLGTIRDDLEERYQQARSSILHNLILTNLLIFLGGGALCYYLALRTLKPIEEAQEAQNRFTADASHELRTPITAMRTENEVTLMNPKLNFKQAKAQLQSNIEELEKLTNLSEGLLRLASAGQNGLNTQFIKLELLVDQAVGRVLPMAEKKNILITQKITEGAEVIGDPVSLAEALVILLDNAIKYSSEKTEVKVIVEQTAKHVTVKVADHGMGIKASELPHIFERFYRADSARSKQSAGGYGLGLAIAKNIADLHRGNLTAESSPSKGSTFILILPK